MTHGPKKEHVMKAKREQQSPPEDIERFRVELARKLDRLVADTIRGWRRCDNMQCRRAKRCASDGFECIAKWQKSRSPVSPEQAQRGADELKRALEARMAGLPMPWEAEPAKKPRRKNAAATATDNSTRGNGDDEAPAPAAYEPPLSPEKAERIDRIWNDYVASLPPEEDKQREPRTRISML
jgi:hypothetical protein